MTIVPNYEAIKMVNDILDSDVDIAYKDILMEYVQENGTLEEGLGYECAARMAFYDPSQPIPEEVREFISIILIEQIEDGNPDAMLDLGSLYYTGRIGEQSYEQAVQYYTMAADRGSLIAMENLGYCYYYGRDVEIDYKKAYHYFIKPALAGRLESIYKIGDMYAKGLYVDEDKDMAFTLYENAYNQIDDDCDVKADICLRMGNCFYYGDGCDKNHYTALMFLQQAEFYYYEQINNGDFYKRKILDGVIDKINKIRQELAEAID